MKKAHFLFSTFMVIAALALEGKAMAEQARSVRTVPIAKDQQGVLSVYKTYVKNRFDTMDLWSSEALAKRRIEYLVHEIQPSLIPGWRAYRGETVDRTGMEVDHAPTEFDQTAFVVGPHESLFLNFFERQNSENGEEFNDISFCAPAFIHELTRSVSTRTHAKDREKIAHRAEELRKTSCRSLVPQVRSLFDFSGTLDKTRSNRMQDLAGFLTFLLTTHHRNHRYATGPDTTLVWVGKEKRIDQSQGWQFRKPFNPSALTPVQVEPFAGGYRLSGFAVINEMSLVRIELDLTPKVFRFVKAEIGEIPYGP
jgi:hypothetical protein